MSKNERNWDDWTPTRLDVIAIRYLLEFIATDRSIVSQAEIAEAAGMSADTLNRFRKDYSAKKASTITNAAKALIRGFHYLLMRNQIHRDQLTPVISVVQSLYPELDWSVPSDNDETLHWIEEKLGHFVHPAVAKISLPFEIREQIRDTALKDLSGLWFIARHASVIPNKARDNDLSLSISLMSIIPDALTRHDYPLFKMHMASNQYAPPQTASGALFPKANLVYFVGIRVPSDELITMVADREFDEFELSNAGPKRRPMRGLILSATHRGGPIASVFEGYHIPTTDDLRGDDFENLAQAATERVGVYDRQEFESLLHQFNIDPGPALFAHLLSESADRGIFLD